MEDVLIKVDKFIFPPNFIVLDLDDGDPKCSLILGRLLLATLRAQADILMGTITTESTSRKIGIQSL